MGNEQSLSAPVSHPRFPKVQYTANRRAMWLRLPVTASSHQHWLKNQSKHQHIYQSPRILRLSQHKLQQQGTCGSGGVLLGRLDGVYPCSLKDDIHKRQVSGNKYSQEALWLLIGRVCRLAAEVYPFGDRHCIGNLHPHQILLDQGGDYLFLVSNYSMSLPDLTDHFQAYRSNGDSQAFIAPQLYGFLGSDKYLGYPGYPHCVDKQSAQAYCLGLTLLSMATLQTHFMSLFRLPKKHQRGTSGLSATMHQMSQSTITQHPALKSLNQTFLFQLLQIVKDNYSPILYEVIMMLLQPEPESRPKLETFFLKWVKVYERSILANDLTWLKQASPPDQDILTHSTTQ